MSWYTGPRGWPTPIQSKHISDTALAAQLQDCYHIASYTATKRTFFLSNLPSLPHMPCEKIQNEIRSSPNQKWISLLKQTAHPGTSSLRCKYFRTILRHGGYPQKRPPRMIEVDIPSQQSTSSCSSVRNSNLHISWDTAGGLAGSESNGTVK